MAKLYFRHGAMNSGKSTNLLQVAHNYEERGMAVLLMKPAVDLKGGEKIISRLGAKREIDVAIQPDTNIFEFVQNFKFEKQNPLDCVLIDEVQFLKIEQIEQLFKIAVILNIPVICYGLRTDFKMNTFEASAKLLGIAHSIEELKTICRCGKKAILNGRKINGKFVFEGEQVAIDTVDNVEYESLCGQCYYKYKSN